MNPFNSVEHFMMTIVGVSTQYPQMTISGQQPNINILGHVYNKHKLRMWGETTASVIHILQELNIRVSHKSGMRLQILAHLYGLT